MQCKLLLRINPSAGSCGWEPLWHEFTEDELAMSWWVRGPRGPGGLSPRKHVPWRTKHFHTRVEPALKSWREAAGVSSFQSTLPSRPHGVKLRLTSHAIGCATKIVISLCNTEWDTIKSIGFILLLNSIYTTQEILQIWPINQWISIKFFLFVSGKIRRTQLLSLSTRSVHTLQLPSVPLVIYLWVTSC